MKWPKIVPLYFTEERLLSKVSEVPQKIQSRNYLFCCACFCSKDADVHSLGGQREVAGIRALKTTGLIQRKKVLVYKRVNWY